MIDKVKIGPYTVNVRRADIYGAYQDFGQFVGMDLTIILDERLSGDHLVDCLMHEIIHAINFLIGRPDDDNDDERYVSTLSVMLIQTLRENPKLLEVILGETIRKP